MKETVDVPADELTPLLGALGARKRELERELLQVGEGPPSLSALFQVRAPREGGGYI
jgi:hypothetical protein